jgi:hypothetical protein
LDGNSLVVWHALPYKRFKLLQRRGKMGPEPPKITDRMAATRPVIVIGSTIVRNMGNMRGIFFKNLAIDMKKI